MAWLCTWNLMGCSVDKVMLFLEAKMHKSLCWPNLDWLSEEDCIHWNFTRAGSKITASGGSKVHPLIWITCRLQLLAMIWGTLQQRWTAGSVWASPLQEALAWRWLEQTAISENQNGHGKSHEIRIWTMLPKTRMFCSSPLTPLVENCLTSGVYLVSDKHMHNDQYRRKWCLWKMQLTVHNYYTHAACIDTLLNLCLSNKKKFHRGLSCVGFAVVTFIYSFMSEHNDDVLKACTIFMNPPLSQCS